MKVLGLHIKERAGGPMLSVDSVDGVAGAGFEGDCQKQVASPRQVLVFSRAILDELGLAPEAVRANVVVDGLVDELPSGTVLRLGKSMSLRLTMPCEPCRKLESHRRGLARALHGRRGMLARVVCGGTANVGDPVAISRAGCRALQECWKARVADIVQNLPDGMLLSYTQLALLAGLQTTYCRAFPRVLRSLRADSALVQAERVVSVKTAQGRQSATRDRYWDGAGYYRGEEVAWLRPGLY